MKKNSKIIDGKLHAQNLLKKLKPFGVKYFEKFGRKPSLAVILLGDNPASQIYVKNKIRISRDNNIKSTEILFPNDISENKLLDKIIELNKNNSIDGILVQLPLPKHISEKIIINTIDPEKDVDGFHPRNFGNLLMGNSNLVPCTPLGCIYMLKNELTNLNGKHAVIIGRSNIVGKPMASLLLSSNCTVTVTHSKTKNLDDICKRADILVAAIGRPAMINENYIKENAIVIDVGINRVENNNHKLSQKKYTLVGDVDYDRVIDKVSKITPVPGGVGPMTIACLMHNTLKAAFLRKKENFISIIEGV